MKLSMNADDIVEKRLHTLIPDLVRVLGKTFVGGDFDCNLLQSDSHKDC